MNLPNILTFSRIPFLFLIVGLLYLAEGTDLPYLAGAAFICFALGALTDWLDGYVARKQGIVSDTGKLMDALTDKIFVLGVMVTLLAFGILPLWGLVLVLLILAREFFITGLRLVAASRGQVLAAEKAGKLKTVMQITALLLLLLGYCLSHDYGYSGAIYETAHIGGLIAFGLAALLTVSSGTTYLVKYGYLFRDEPEKA
ncbi:MAG: CDP-diacylglycerol--glycerol-3-phosphate 3-phosphatidyltransferase [Opitutales bacterium]